jgi:hypothetical protein
MMKRRELAFQSHVIDSYKSCGGYGRKWATELMVGVPDLICTLPEIGLHLVEMKHRPEWSVDAQYRNPLTPKQKMEALAYVRAGGLAVGYVVVASSEAIGSQLCIFDPTLAEIVTDKHVPYRPGPKFDVKQLMAMERTAWKTY